MNLINFSKANCKNCYRCLRSCPVKAIQIKDEQANIIEDRCIACGHCLSVCPQDARNIRSDLGQIKRAIAENRTVIASLAPSFAGAFEMSDSGQMAAALKQLGFSVAEETAVGADIITRFYKKYMAESNNSNLITTCCPSVNYLIEKYHPSLIQYMIPAVSPMLAHGKLLKNIYGSDTYVVFIGPCMAKKAEAFGMQHIGSIDSVLTFEELNQWINEEAISLKELTPEDFDHKASSDGCCYPISGGITGSISKSDSKEGYSMLKVDGVNKCLEVFQALENGMLENAFIEASICEGSCLGGPGMPKYNHNYFRCYQRVRDYVSKRKTLGIVNTGSDFSLDIKCLSKDFHNKYTHNITATTEDLSKVLKKMGKPTPADELNCGACGYNTCREKAKAVLEGMAEMSMCLPYMRSKAESLTNVIFEQSPNVIMLIDLDSKIKEFNPTAERLFNISAQEVKDKPVGMLMDDSDFVQVMETKQNIYKKKVCFSQNEQVFMMNLVYLEKQSLILAIMMDVTMNEKSQEELKKVKQNTLEAAQEVITKQMRVAQEIAGLLGETTAETKVILTKLKEIVIGETGELE